MNEALIKHDGNLGHNAVVWYEDMKYITEDGDVFYNKEINISDKMRWISLIPKEALSLLEWLKQEEPRLRKMIEDEASQ
jgi:hypothetical protein